ncbi:hypothetical protein H8S20_18340 [Clostridium sp. NSJ-6]|uniref:Uncharacterized protein n=1 Tax=Clostridium hominis TaxID=2763036 RepID=A0ABR7DHI9_9CLOT|nr:hypothetical protein [Clostridium hominis]MBC5630817.1 hypothetical protein [Clostridium hominis]
MNSLSQEEINAQLFYLSKEAVKTIVLESKCGLVSSIKNFKNLSPSFDINTMNNFSPLLCVYRKASPNFIHSKNSNGFDEDSFKKEINPSTNALMTLCLLELLDYYRCFENIERSTYSIYEIYNSLTKEQLQFYSENLRNSEGVFADKKNMFENNSKNYNLVDKDKKFKFSDQAFMMLAYYLYSYKNKNDAASKDYETFSLEILQMFLDFKENIYECSLDELCKILLAFNILYSYCHLENLQTLIADISDYTMNKFDDKDYYVTSLDTAALCAIVLTLSYKNTNIIAFKDKSKAIIDKLYSLYDEENECFYKLSSKKEIKYSSLDITFYLLAFILNDNTRSEYKNLISSVYKKYLINSGLVTSWPEAPTLDDYERYRGLSLVSKDMLDESYFRMPNVITPSSSGMAPVFNKYVTYNKRKNSFTVNKSSFESSKNFLIFYLYIYLFKDNFIKSLALDRVNLSNEPESIPEILQASTSKASDMDVNYIASVSPTSTTNSNTTIEEASINTNTNIPSEENETLSENLEITDN